MKEKVMPQVDEQAVVNGKIPERALLVAVLWRSYYDLDPHVMNGAQVMRDAINWFRGRGKYGNAAISYKLVKSIIELSASQQEFLEKAVSDAEEFLKHNKQQVPRTKPIKTRYRRRTTL